MVSDETIAGALIVSGSAIAAAQTLGVAASTIYRRMKSPEFQVLYCTLKADLMRGICAEYRDLLTDALSVQSEIMLDETINPAIRLQASQCLISSLRGLHEKMERTEKDLQQAQACSAAKGILLKAINKN